MKHITLSLIALLFLVTYGNALQIENEELIHVYSTQGDILVNNNASLFWDNNGADINSTANSTAINLSSDISSTFATNVYYTILERTWRFIETEENNSTVRIKIPLESILNDSSIGNYYMFISDSGIFDSTSNFKLMSKDEDGFLETDYTFNDTTYITFGFSPQVTAERSIYFNGSTDYIDMENKLDLNPTGFTISAWVKRDATDTGDVSILSKRNVSFTEGYDLTLTNTNKVNIKWKNGAVQSLTSYTSIPNNQWHHIAITYNESRVSIYIDGVLDNSAIKAAPVASNTSFHIAAAGKRTPIQHFKGHIDEVRIWNRALTESQLRFIMNQEIMNNSGQVMGKELPVSLTKNEINTVPWSDLAAYYPMSIFTYKNTIDASGNGNDGQLKNLLSVDRETAPLPYKSIQDGDWDKARNWNIDMLQYPPGSTSIVNPNTTIDWNIVRTSHTISMNNLSLPSTKFNNRTLLGLFVDDNDLIITGKTLSNTGNGLTITHYLSLTGKIDLEDESQLIQTPESNLEVIANGKIECDQQGTADKYTYNYWSSPVTKMNTIANNFKVSDVLKDGTDASNPLAINFSSSGYDGAPTLPIKIADYWIWKYANHPTQSYSAWQHIRRTGNILPGEGFTMKGPGTGSIKDHQNYVFIGKPNNGDINLTLAPNNEYLVGNPYPSAIDANIFIRDNGPELTDESSQNPAPKISGTLYFWKHWGGGSHILQEYQGGYATYNYSGSVAAASMNNINIQFQLEDEASKKPGRYIPVGQGFFILGENGGTINFNNGQRVFKKEANTSSEFMRSINITAPQDTYEDDIIDERMKFRIGFNSVNTIRRQLLLTIDENATPYVDWAYDGKLNESQIDDMFWVIDDKEYIIQASNDAAVSAKYPLGIKTDTDGTNTIGIDKLENVPPDFNIYIHDKGLDLYHDLRQGDYSIFLNEGEYLNRFEITFGTDADVLGIEDNEKNSIDVLYSNDIEKIVLINPNLIDVKSISIFNLLGQSVDTFSNITKSTHSEYNLTNLSAGAYIIKLITVNQSEVTKKIIVE